MKTKDFDLTLLSTEEKLEINGGEYADWTPHPFIPGMYWVGGRWIVSPGPTIPGETVLP